MKVSALKHVSYSLNSIGAALGRTSLKVAFGFLGIAALVLAACSPENPRLMARPPQPVEANQKLSPEVSIEKPKLRVLFLMDDSGSMKDEQENLVKNMGSFVNAISERDQAVDMQFAVMSVWDRFTYEEMEKPYQKGELQRVRAATELGGRELIALNSSSRFVDNQAQYGDLSETQKWPSWISIIPRPWIEILKSTLTIGVQPFNSNWRKEKTGGPNHEEFLSPLVEAWSESKKEVNSDFFNPSQFNHLAVVIVSDADLQFQHPETRVRQDLGLSDFKRRVIDQFGPEYKDLFSVHGVLASKDDAPDQCDPVLVVKKKVGKETRSECRDPLRLIQLVTEMGGIHLRLQDPSFGQALASLGRNLKQKVRHSSEYVLKAIPEKGTIVVRLGEWQLLEGEEWKFNPGQNSVELMRPVTELARARTNSKEEMDASFDYQVSISYTKVRPAELLK